MAGSGQHLSEGVTKGGTHDVVLQKEKRLKKIFKGGEKKGVLALNSGGGSGGR